MPVYSSTGSLSVGARYGARGPQRKALESWATKHQDRSALVLGLLYQVSTSRLAGNGTGGLAIMIGPTRCPSTPMWLERSMNFCGNWSREE
jgi:hypothetical protein